MIVSISDSGLVEIPRPLYCAPVGLQAVELRI
jgi:hypothetical protein